MITIVDRVLRYGGDRGSRMVAIVDRVWWRSSHGGDRGSVWCNLDRSWSVVHRLPTSVLVLLVAKVGTHAASSSGVNETYCLYCSEVCSPACVATMCAIHCNDYDCPLHWERLADPDVHKYSDTVSLSFSF